MNEEASTPSQREKRHAVLYFSPKNSSAYKELAARIRSDGGRTTLVWSGKWKGAESILTECRAIVIEKGCANATDIQESYRRYAVDCEIHFADANGEFTEDEEAETVTESEAVVETEGATDDEEKRDDTDTASDAIVEEEGGEGDDPVDPDGDGADGGPSSEGGEAGQEGASDPERTPSD